MKIISENALLRSVKYFPIVIYLLLVEVSWNMLDTDEEDLLEVHVLFSSCWW